MGEEIEAQTHSQVRNIRERQRMDQKIDKIDNIIEPVEKIKTTLDEQLVDQPSIEEIQRDIQETNEKLDRILELLSE